MQKPYKSVIFSTLWVGFIWIFFLGIPKLLFDSNSLFSFIITPLGALLSTLALLQIRTNYLIKKTLKRVCKPILKIKPLKENTKKNYISHIEKRIKHFAKSKKSEIELLKNRDSFRKEFIGDISHELKTPVFTIQSYILTLLDGALEKKIAREYLLRAANGADRLSYITKDLDTLHSLEIEGQALNIETFDVKQLIEETFKLLEIKAMEKQILLTFDIPYPPTYVIADKAKIQQVVSNLIINSIKYGSEKGTTEIIIDEFSKTQIIIRITDNGEGIEKQYLDRIFERFFRIDRSRSRQEGGSGLGLAIVKHIIEAHKQSIFAKSIYKTGSEFAFTLQKSDKKYDIKD